MAIQQVLLMGTAAGGGGTAYATWDATKKPSHATRTSGTVVTCNTTDGSYTTVGCTTGQSSGKWLFRMKCTTNDFFTGIGSVSGATVPWTNSNYLGYTSASQGNSVGYQNYSGGLQGNSKTSGSYGGDGTPPGVAANAYLTVAVDLDSSPQTVKVYDGNTLKGTIDIASSDSGLTWYPCASLLFSGDVCTLDAGATTAIAIPTPLAGLGYNRYWG